MSTFIIDGDTVDCAYFDRNGNTVYPFDNHHTNLAGNVVIFPTAHHDSRKQAIDIQRRLDLHGVTAQVVDVDALEGGYRYYADGSVDSPENYFEAQIAKNKPADLDQFITDLISTLPLVGWLEPIPLTQPIDPLPYPLDALPEALKAAIAEVHNNVQSPLEMCATSLLTALATAAQGHYNVKRDEGAVLPISLYSLIVADSGERKTSTDNVTFASIADFERAERDRLAPDLTSYETKLEAWSAEREGVKNRIKNGKNKVEREGEKAVLLALDNEQPEKPIMPRFIFSDVTSEKLAYALTEYPSAVLKTSEAGIVFGGHLLSSDKAMATFAIFNRLWEGGSETVDRKTSKSFRLDGVRLSISMQVQAPVLQDFLAKNGRIADGIGFIPRCLLSNPPSTKGTRPYQEPSTGAAMAVFNRRVTELLNRPLPISEHDRLEPTVLLIEPDAKAVWIKFFNEVEQELKQGGEYCQISGAASKTAEQALRIAACIYIFDNDAGMVDVPSMTAGIAIAKYHLHEALRFFNELSLPEPVANAIKLGNWLLKFCQEHGADRVRKRYAMQHSPLRTKALLEAALEELKQAYHIKEVKDGRHTEVVINPTILDQCKNSLFSFATATPATPATHSHENKRSVATVATVAVANAEIENSNDDVGRL